LGFRVHTQRVLLTTNTAATSSLRLAAVHGVVFVSTAVVAIVVAASTNMV
jgi:hypothetical protein